MTRNELIKYIEDHGREDSLDEIVHTIASIMASNINNSGTEKQVDYLLQEGIDIAYIFSVVEEE